MITQMAYREAKQRAADLLGQTGVSLTQDELAQIAVADFGLGDLEKVGAQILTLLDSPEIAAKLIVLFPWQVLPEHRHPPLGLSGKRKRYGASWYGLSVCGRSAYAWGFRCRTARRRQHGTR